MNKIIKWVYFDVGGVVIKDFSKSNKWEKMKKDLLKYTEDLWIQT